MEQAIRETLWRQYGAAMDMLENAITACPEDVWSDRSRPQEYWYWASHTIFWTDYYMSESVENFAPPAPFGLEELDPAGVMPPRVYTKDELLVYLNHCRQKVRTAIMALDDATSHLSCGAKRPQLTKLEILLYDLRHVQHHTAQLNMLLRQTIDSAPRWVSIAREPLTRT